MTNTKTKRSVTVTLTHLDCRLLQAAATSACDRIDVSPSDKRRLMRAVKTIEDARTKGKTNEAELRARGWKP